MELLNVVKSIDPGHIQCSVFLPVHPFTFKRSEKTFAGCVVVTMPDGTHRVDQPFLFQERLIVPAAELTATVLVQDHRPNTLPLPDCHLYRTNDHLTILAVMHRPLQLGDADIKRFLTWLAVERNVATSTPSAALNAIAFFRMT